MWPADYKLSPARRIQLKRAGIRLQQILARLAALEDEFKRLNAPARPNELR